MALDCRNFASGNGYSGAVLASDLGGFAVLTANVVRAKMVTTPGAVVVL
jgi:hypothetical protein